MIISIISIRIIISLIVDGHLRRHGRGQDEGAARADNVAEVRDVALQA